jgi:glucose/arabinose dehydrogenase
MLSIAVAACSGGDNDDGGGGIDAAASMGGDTATGTSGDTRGPSDADTANGTGGDTATGMEDDTATGTGGDATDGTGGDGTDGSPEDRTGVNDTPYEGPPFVDEDPTVQPPTDHPDFDEHPNLSKIQLPPGFEIRMYAEVPNARSLELASDGTLFVGNRSGNEVFAVRDTDDDFDGDEVLTIASGLNRPNGVAMKDGDLYVAEVGKVWRFPDILDNLQNPSKTLVTDAFPTDGHHGWKFIEFGPDGKLYVPVGAPCNVCNEDYGTYSNIRRMDPDGSNLETYVKGVRNTVGFDWHPKSGELWFTDNGRDNMGDNRPPDELNRVTRKGEHFGFPYCHGGYIQDPNFDSKGCEQFVPPTRKLGPHVAALGIEFYEGEMFPDEYQNMAFIAEHGSWNRSNKIGYRVTLVRLNDSNEATSYEVFARGWLQGESEWGRPVDVEVMSDGSMLVSDDASGHVYRIVYEGQ